MVVAVANEDREKTLESPSVAGETTEDNGIKPADPIGWFHSAVLSMVVKLDDGDDTLGSSPGVNGDSGGEYDGSELPVGGGRYFTGGGLGATGDDDLDDMPQPRTTVRADDGGNVHDDDLGPSIDTGRCCNGVGVVMGVVSAGIREDSALKSSSVEAASTGDGNVDVDDGDALIEASTLKRLECTGLFMSGFATNFVPRRGGRGDARLLLPPLVVVDVLLQLLLLLLPSAPPS